MKELQIIATINTNKITNEFLQKLLNRGANIFRLNGAHVKVEDIGSVVGKIRRVCGKNVEILIDLPGNKIRTSGLYQSIALRNGEKFELRYNNFNFDSFIRFLNVDDIVISSDGQLKMIVSDVRSDKVIFEALCDGKLLNNKGIHVQKGNLAEMPFLFEKDREIIKESKKYNIDYAGFSFVRTPYNVKEAFDLIGASPIKPIIKLETREATNKENLSEILKLAEYFLIDRGDLASEVGVTRFPRIFNNTMTEAVEKGKKLFVATQLFASMYENYLPYLSEVIEFHRLANSGIEGIQLSEEIAVGKHPFEVLELIKSICKEEC